MTDAIQNSTINPVVKRKSKLEKLLTSRTLWRGVIALIGAIVFWEVCSQSKVWFGIEVPWIGKVPPPTEVVAAWEKIIYYNILLSPLRQ